MSELLDAIRETVRRRHLSHKTERAYVRWAERYVRYHARRAGHYVHPREFGEAEVEALLNHLANDRDVAASTQTQALSALLFLYDAVLVRPLSEMGGLTRVRKPPRMPTVLSRSEVHALLGHLRGVHWLVGGLLYGAGLRISGVLRLRVKDPDVERQQVTVRSGKGDRDRVTELPAVLV